MDLKNKHVLITQLRLFDFAGSEIVTLELVEEFSRRGARVSVVVGGFGDPIIKEFEAIKNVSLYKIDDPKFEEAYRKQPVDIAWIHHQIIPDIVLENYTKTRFIFNHMSAMIGIEMPIFYRIEDALADKIVFNSKETARKTIEQGFIQEDDSRINILYNAAPEHFSNGQLSQNEEVKTVGVVSNHIPKEVKEALDLLEENDKIKVIRFGAHAGEVYKRITPADIERLDVVLTIGKTVQYAIVGGRPVYCYDKFGGPGYLAENNLEVAMKRNFSGLGFSKKSAEDISQEVVNQYTKAKVYAKELQEKLSSTLSLEARIDTLLDQLSTKKQDVQDADIASYKILRTMITTKYAHSAHAQQNLKMQLNAAQNVSRQKENDIQQLQMQLSHIKESISYRVGNRIASPIRFGKRYIEKLSNDRRRPENILTAYYKKVPKKGIKVSLVLKDAHSPNSSSFIRLISPLIHAKKYDIQIVDGGKWSDIRPDTEVCIVQRVALADEHEAEKLISFLKKNDILLMTDNDDAFCDVGVDHAHYSQIHPRSSGLTLLMKHAAANFYSTEKLRDRYGELTSRTDGIVVRNMLDKELWPRWQRNDIGSPDMHEPLRVVYMGTKTHGADFLMIKNAFQRVHEDMPGSFELTVIGVASEIENEEWITTITPENSVYPGFTRWFSEQGPFDIGLSPLEDTEFNSAKSDIKCLDYIALGARPLVSDVLAYENSELNEYIARVKNTENDWYEAFKQCVLDREHIRQDRSWVTEGYDFLQKKRSVDVTSARMIKIIQKYMAR